MLGPYKIIVDEWSEVWDLLKPYADGSFWQWNQIKFDPDCYYIIGRLQLKENWQQIRDLCLDYPGHIIFCNPAEGSQTILLQLQRLRIRNLVMNENLGLITSGNLESGHGELSIDCYFSNIVEYLENIAAHKQSPNVYDQINKPYQFLFLNGRLRPHRKYLIDQLRMQGLLEQALWTNLQNCVDMGWTSQLETSKLEQIRLLPPEYEIERARPNLTPGSMDGNFVKHRLFNDTWGDAIVNPQAYIDTYFSLVTETIFDYPYTFRTEKIWKPMIMCHPFVVAANRGYYRDLHNVGFKTFGNLIDESFDLIDDPAARADKIVAVVRDICYNGASKFLIAAREVCEHNYEHLREYNQRERNQLPERLKLYINER